MIDCGCGKKPASPKGVKEAPLAVVIDSPFYLEEERFKQALKNLTVQFSLHYTVSCPVKQVTEDVRIQCRQNLIDPLADRDPKVLLLCGRAAIRSFNRDFWRPKQVAGYPFSYGVRIMFPTYHPIALARDDTFDKFCSHLEKAENICMGESWISLIPEECMVCQTEYAYRYLDNGLPFCEEHWHGTHHDR